MALIELILVLSGACISLFYLARVFMMLAPKVFWPVPRNLFTSVGKWAVITGGSEGIGKAYAEEFARRGLNVVIISRSKEKLDRAARDIEVITDRKVMVLTADFTKDDIYEHIKENIQGLDIAVLVNNVGIQPSILPYKLLEIVHLEKKINQLINCNVKSVIKMCQIVLPGMVERLEDYKQGRGVILNTSTGMSKVPYPLYTLYSASKVFVQMFAQGLQAEYKSKGILIQSVTPFGISTAMTGFQKPSIITLTPEDFVKSSLKYLKAGEETYGSINHAVLGWIMQAIPTWVLRREAFHNSFQDYVKKEVGS